MQAEKEKSLKPVNMLPGDCPRLCDYLQQMYARPNAPPRIAEAMAALGT